MKRNHWLAAVGLGIGGGLFSGSLGFAQGPPATPVPDVSRPVTVTVTRTDQPGVLTPPGKLLIEPSLQYSNSSSNRVAFVGIAALPEIVVTIGVNEVREISRDSFIGALTFRLGLANRLEMEAKLPYVSRSDTTTYRALDAPTGAPNSVFDANGRGLGDIEAALRYQLNTGQGGRPYFIGNLRVKSHTGKNPFEVEIDPSAGLPTELPTGTGFWGVQPSLSVLYPSDPAVLFGNLSYLWNVRRDLGDPIGTINPADMIGVNFGMGFALNERASFSIGYDHSVVGKDQQNGITIPNAVMSQVGSLILGYSLRLNNRTSVNIALSAGLTEAAPDMQLTIRVPTCCVAIP